MERFNPQPKPVKEEKKKTYQLKRSPIKRKLKPKEKKAIDKESSQALVKKLDKYFSLFIRQKHSENGLVECYTCRKKMEINQIQCGHYHSRRFYSVRWEEMNCRPQCVSCNVFKHGNYPEFSKRLIEDHGRQYMDLLEVKKNRKVKLERTFLKVMIEHYKNLVK